MKRLAISTLGSAMIVAFAGLATMSPAHAQYPDRPITVIVPFAAGGTTDVVARLMGDPMSRILKQQVVVENVTGAGGTVGVTRAKNASPDGYTILMGNLGTQAASVGLYPKLAYDPRTDFEPIMNTGGTPMLVVAKKDLPVKDFKEFITYLKANAAKMNYGTGGVGATSHLTCLYLDYLLDAKPTHIPFRGSGPALNALLSGSVDYVCDQTVGVVPTIQAGKANGLVVATPERISVVPNVPTSKEQGLPDFQAIGWNALFAPKGTPKDIVEKLNAAARAALKDENTRKRLLDLGIILPTDAEQTPAALGEHVRKEIDKWVPVIKKSGVMVQ